MIFRELQKAKKRYAEGVLNGTNEDEIALKKKQLGMVVMLLKLIDEKWDIADKSKAYLKDALEMNIEDVAKKYDTTENAVRKMLSVRAKEFEKKIGYSTLQSIEQGKIDAAMLQFKQSWGLMTTDDLFSDYFLKELKVTSVADASIIQLSQCTEELKLLRLHCKDMIEKQIAGVDKEKVRSIFKLLTGDSSVYTVEKGLLLDFFTGVISYGELLKALKELNF